jgi:hypothetical protein
MLCCSVMRPPGTVVFGKSSMRQEAESLDLPEDPLTISKSAFPGLGANKSATHYIVNRGRRRCHCCRPHMLRYRAKTREIPDKHNLRLAMDHAIAYNIHVVLLSFIQLVSVVTAVMGWIAIGEVNRGMSVFRKYKAAAKYQPDGGSDMSRFEAANLIRLTRIPLL